MELVDYVLKNTERGACTCGKCLDGVPKPEKHQPSGHTVNLTFFKISAKPTANKDEFESLVKKEFPEYFDGKEHSYLQVGGDVGDQGIALMLIGLGHLLGSWKALSPDTMMPFLDDAMKQQMAGMGMVSLKANAESALAQVQ